MFLEVEGTVKLELSQSDISPVPPWSHLSLDCPVWHEFQLLRLSVAWSVWPKLASSAALISYLLLLSSLQSQILSSQNCGQAGPHTWSLTRGEHSHLIMLHLSPHLTSPPSQSTTHPPPPDWTSWDAGRSLQWGQLCRPYFVGLYILSLSQLWRKTNQWMVVLNTPLKLND